MHICIYNLYLLAARCRRMCLSGVRLRKERCTQYASRASPL